jgi:hypothetical protein
MTSIASSTCQGDRVEVTCVARACSVGGVDADGAWVVA